MAAAAAGYDHAHPDDDNDGVAIEFSDDEDVTEMSADGLETYDKAVMRAKRKGTRLPALKQYTDSLVYVLKEFSLREPEHLKPNTIDSGGGFMDCGSLRPNTECKITIEVTNLMVDIATLDVKAIGFPDENTDVVTYAKPLVSGMTRQISIHFNVGMREGCTLAQVHMTLVTNHSRLEVILPVFLRVDHSTMPRIVANVRTLSSLEHKYHGIFKPATIAFDRKKDRDSHAWIKPEELERARRSIHEHTASTEQRMTLERRIKSRNKDKARRKEKETQKQTQTGSRALLQAALSSYLPTIPDAKPISAEENKRTTMLASNSKTPPSSAPAGEAMRSRKTAFFAEGMTVQLYRPKHLQ